MIGPPEQLTLEQWDRRYDALKKEGLSEPYYGGALRRHVDDGDLRLLSIEFDNSPAALNLWNFLLTEEERLAKARAEGKKLVGAMKDLGTIPILAYSSRNLVAFYPDGAWWIPCVMQLSDGLLGLADSMGVDESFCPVRAMLGAFVTGAHFPLPDLLVCSVGAVCDDFSAIAQRVAGLGHPVLFWEIPRRRRADAREDSVFLPGGVTASAVQTAFVKSELERVRKALDNLSGTKLTDEAVAAGILEANAVRSRLDELRNKVFTAEICPMPAIEMLVAEMLAIHYCSDRGETIKVLSDLLNEVSKRIAAREGYFDRAAARVFWVNPVADLTVMNLLEQCGGRICGTEYLFSHALDLIPTHLPPMEALARAALADPMVGPTADRADRIIRDIARFGCEAAVVSKIPGASHCAFEGAAIGERIRSKSDIPVLEIEVPPVSDAFRISLRTRLEALVETVLQNRKRKMHHDGEQP